LDLLVNPNVFTTTVWGCEAAHIWLKKSAAAQGWILDRLGAAHYRGLALLLTAKGVMGRDRLAARSSLSPMIDPDR